MSLSWNPTGSDQCCTHGNPQDKTRVAFTEPHRTQPVLPSRNLTGPNPCCPHGTPTGPDPYCTHGTPQDDPCCTDGTPQSETHVALTKPHETRVALTELHSTRPVLHSQNHRMRVALTEPHRTRPVLHSQNPVSLPSNHRRRRRTYKCRLNNYSADSCWQRINTSFIYLLRPAEHWPVWRCAFSVLGAPSSQIICLLCTLHIDVELPERVGVAPTVAEVAVPVAKRFYELALFQ